MKDKTSHGFTLIEVLIAMALLSIMVVLLFGSLKICADSWYKGENKIAQVNEVAVVYNFFQQHLAVAKPLVKDLKQNDLQPSLAFQGKNQSLQFASAFPASVGKLGLQLFSIELAKEDKEQVIKVTITPLLSTEESENHKEEVILLRGLSDFSLTYFGSDDGGDMSNGSWHDEWLEKPTQPRLVKIAIQLNNGAFWPELVIPLKITGQYNVQDQAINTAVPIQ
jgi:general secretion pathway protein J